jgi:hypothetical protein
MNYFQADWLAAVIMPASVYWCFLTLLAKETLMLIKSNATGKIWFVITRSELSDEAISP